MIAGREDDFERDFDITGKIIAAAPGYIERSLERCIETSNRYLLLVRWRMLEHDQTVCAAGLE